MHNEHLLKDFDIGCWYFEAKTPVLTSTQCTRWNVRWVTADADNHAHAHANTQITCVYILDMKMILPSVHSS